MSRDEENSLTPKQGEVLDRLLRRLSNAEIAAELAITEATVKAHVSAILAKLRCKSRHEVVRHVNGARENSSSQAGA